MRIGVLVNPSAGRGQRAQAVISLLEARWQGHELLAVAGPAAPCFSRAELLPEPTGGYVEKIFGSVRTLLIAGAEMIVTLGGDGTAAYAAEALGDARKVVPLLGIGLGTANVGPIVTLTAEDELPPLVALTLSARALVSYEEDDRGFDAFAPEERLLFSEEDEIAITHLAPETLAVCDGNPYPIADRSVALRYMPQEILVAERR